MSKNMLYMIRLGDIRKKSHRSDGKIADYILSNRSSVANMTLMELAENTQTGYATVCRFFKRLGASGFKEFKKIFSKEMENTDSSPDIDSATNIDTNLDFNELNKRICEYSSSIVSNCGRLISTDDLEQVVTLIKNASHIQFVGVGTSAVTARYAYTKFFRVKPSCSFDVDPVIAKMRTSQLDKNSLIFAISSSGRTKNIIETVRIARQKNISVVSVCDFVDSPLAHLSNVSLCTTVRDSNKYIDLDFPLIQGQITLIDILYACVYNKLSCSAFKSIQITHDAVRSDKLNSI
ncbi:MAG: MurR/RpiR family transcriptional regulator [Clostridia bacterium]|nr:MurR/RpiR family transcriptional regulator [Clostridia bacterium]